MFKNILPFIFLSAVYALSFWVISENEQFPLEEVLVVLVILGGFFSPLAYFISLGSKPLEDRIPLKNTEPWALTILFLYICVIIIFGSRSVLNLLPQDLASSALIQEIIGLCYKLVFFVFIPFGVYAFFYQFGWKDFGFIADVRKAISGRYGVILLVMALFFILFQWFAGRAAEPIRQGEFNVYQLSVGMPIVFLWLLFEVGLVEEFFFRALMQDRIAAWTSSLNWGLVISVILFGMAHAPGMYLREAAQVEGLGESPSLWACIAYCILVQATAGIPFAIIWAKTRNLWLLMMIHASIDLLSNFKPLMVAFNL